VGTWYHWQTLCGRELIGHVVEDQPVTCQVCTRSYAGAERRAAELRSKFG
jgi:hypothetical protein